MYCCLRKIEYEGLEVNLVNNCNRVGDGQSEIAFMNVLRGIDDENQELSYDRNKNNRRIPIQRGSNGGIQGIARIRPYRHTLIRGL